MRDNLLTIVQEEEERLAGIFTDLENTALENLKRVLAAFHKVRVSSHHLCGTTGYGYNDGGREALDQVIAYIFGAEKGLLRGQIVSGTHALALGLYGALEPGEEILSITGPPYDTLREVIGLGKPKPGSLASLGIGYREVSLKADGSFDYQGIKESLSLGFRIKLVYIQRSRGYSWRPALTVERIGEAIEFIKKLKPGVVVLVDNCYGEMVETLEPTHVGADLVAGSMIKNLGGGLAPTGGYLTGKAEWVERAAERLTAPGIGSEVGATLDWNRAFFQGIFMAPTTVKEALKGAILAAAVFGRLGFSVSPGPEEKRGDIVQAIKLGRPELVEAFCRAIQASSPIDAHVQPVAWGMPGYDDAVIMAAGTLIQGASIELSADAPMREPYIVYLQGGLSYAHVKLGIINAAKSLINF